MFKRIAKYLYNFREYFILVLLLLISLILLSFNDSDSMKNVRRFGFGTFAIVSSGVNSINSFLKDDAEIERLKRINAELMLDVNNLRKYGLENQKLKKLLDIRPDSNFTLKAATIISRNPSLVQGDFIINVGEADSISPGMPVIDEMGLIGVVFECTDDFSIVRSLQNSKMKISGKVQKNNVYGIISWNGSKLLMKNVPTTSSVEIGDRIVTSDFSTVTPPSIPIGYVSEIEENISGLLTDVVISPFVELNKVKDVFVIELVQSQEINGIEINLLKR